MLFGISLPGTFVAANPKFISPFSVFLFFRNMPAQLRIHYIQGLAYDH